MSKAFPVLTLIFLFASCSESPRESKADRLTDTEAQQYANQITDEISVTTSEDLEATLWASEKLMRDPVALDVDRFGRVLVTITERRRNAEIDIRGHSDWMIESGTLETTEQRRDFLHRKLAPKRSEENTWLTDHNDDGSHDWRDLMVSKESILRIEDSTGNGYANRSELLIRDFNEEITDVAGAVLFHEGDVFLGVSPDLWRIQDTNGDGYGDEQTSISHGYGVNVGFGGHGMSALTTGPDGRIYWSIGDVGMSVVDQAAHLLPPINRFDDGHSGVAYNPGTALSKRWQDHYFVGKFVGSPANSGIHP